MNIRIGGFEVEIGFNGVVPVNLFISAGRLGSVFVEGRKEWVGFGVERSGRGDCLIFAGRLEVAFSKKAAARYEGPLGPPTLEAAPTLH